MQGNDYYEITFYTIIDGRAVKSSYNLSGNKEKLRRKLTDLRNEVQISDTESDIDFANRQQFQRNLIDQAFQRLFYNEQGYPVWTNGRLIYNATAELCSALGIEYNPSVWVQSNDEQSKQQVKQEVTNNLRLHPQLVQYLNTNDFSEISPNDLPGSNITGLLWNIEVEVSNFGKFLNETVGTKKTKLFFFINYLLKMGGTSQLDSLTGISENDITLIEQILKSKGDDVLNDFFKDSKIASKSFSLKDPRWKGTKKDSNNDVVSWFPDFTSDQERAQQLKQLITSPFYTHSAVNMKSQRLYDPFPINSEKPGEDEITLLKKAGRLPSKLIGVNKPKKDEILKQIITHNYVTPIEKLDDVLNIWEGWIRANYFNSPPRLDPRGGNQVEMIETLIGLQTSLVYRTDTRKYILGDVKYILETPIKLSQYKGPTRIGNLKRELKRKYGEMYCNLQPTDQKANLQLTKTSALFGENYNQLSFSWATAETVDNLFALYCS